MFTQIRMQSSSKAASPAVATSTPRVQTTVASPLSSRLGVPIQRKCAACENEEEQKPLQRKGEPAASAAPGAESAARAASAAQRGGQELPRNVRTLFEPRFGYDFSKVRVHVDPQAAKGVGARAFTIGRDIVFGAGEYAPGTTHGRRLLAHELAHVVQQGTGSSAVTPGVSNPHDPAEYQADLAADAVMRDEADATAEGTSALAPLGPVRSSSPAVQRQPAPPDQGARFNTAMSSQDWPAAVRILADMSDEDARAALSALQTDARAALREAAIAMRSSSGERVAVLIDAAERGATSVPASAPAPAVEDIASLSASEKLLRAWNYADIRGAARDEIANLFTPTSLAIMAGFVVAYIAAQLTPIGWVADAIALVSLTVAAIFMGRLLFQIVEDLYTFFSCVNATTRAELQRAGAALARAIARGGVQIVLLLLTRGMRGGRGRGTPYRTPPPSRGAELVTNEGVVVRVPPEALPEVPAPNMLRGPMPETPPRPQAPGPTRPPVTEPPVSGPRPRPTEATPQTPAEPAPQLGEGALPGRVPLTIPLPPRPQVRCPVPANELTEFVQWGSQRGQMRTAGGWRQTLVPAGASADWTGCEVAETGPVDDQCWVPGSPCAKATAVDGSRWTCSGDEWGLDWVGVGEDCVNYYQQHSRLPCRMIASQTMQIENDSGVHPYKQNELIVEIHRDKVVSMRDEESAERPWPPSARTRP